MIEKHDLPSISNQKGTQQMKIDIDVITLDESIYPRSNKSPQKVEEYAEKLVAGVKFPPIEVQKIVESDEESTVLIDGYHRWQAHKLLVAQPDLLEGAKTDYSVISALYWKSPVLEKATWINDLRIRAVELNKHGMPTTRQDLERQAVKIATDDPKHEKSSEEIAKAWDLSDRTVRGWIQHIRAGQRARRDRDIYRLSMLGWTQEEIAGTTGINRQRVAQIASNGEIAKIGASIEDWKSKGKTIAEAAEKLEIDATLAWAIYLKDKDDNFRLEKINEALKGIDVTPRPFDVWNFAQCMPIAGDESYAGRIPGQILLNLLWFFTKQGDLVIDPMAGGGTTVDACLLLNRKCYGYDITPSRKDISEHDITSSEINMRKADLVFLDPPYFKKKAKEYKLPKKYLTKEGFMGFANSWVDFCQAVAKPGSIVALLISDFVDYTNPEQSIFSDEYAALFESNGFERLYKISCDLSTEQYKGHDVADAREAKKLLIRGRELYILRKYG